MTAGISVPEPSIFEASLEDFEHSVITQSHSKPVLVDLWAEWCSPCIIIAPVLEQFIHENHGDILLAKVEVDEGENMKLAGRFQVRGFPTVIVFEEGQEVARFSGAKTLGYIRTFADDNIRLL